MDRRRPDWERLASLLRQVSSRGLRSLSGPELVDLGKLYRRVTSDLSYVNANSTNDELITYLNELAGRAHGHLYSEAPKSGMRSAISFLLGGFPILFRARWRFIAVAGAILILSSAFSAVVVARNPDTACHFLPKQMGGG